MTTQPILVLTTGGTIDKQYFDATSEYQIADSVIPRLLSIARVTHPFECRELLHKDSLDLTDADRELIVEHVRTSGFARIVVTHGTDTMTSTAQVLAAIPDKTIVLTGALAPARFNETDASFNLGMAFAAAQVAQPGVYIAMNGYVFRGDGVVKDRAQQRFRFPGSAIAVGMLSVMAAVWCPDAQAARSCPRVEHGVVHPQASPDTRPVRSPQGPVIFFDRDPPA